MIEIEYLPINEIKQTRMISADNLEEEEEEDTMMEKTPNLCVLHHGCDRK